MRSEEHASQPTYHDETGAPPTDETESGQLLDFRPGIQVELTALAALGFSKPLIAKLAGLSRQNGTTVEAELLACGDVREDAYYGAIARLLRLPFVSSLDPALVVILPSTDAQLTRPTMVRIAHRNKAQEIAIVPEAARLSQIAATLATLPLVGRDLVITTPSAIRESVWKADAARRIRETTNTLFEQRPLLSARVVLAGHQGFYGGSFLTTLACLLLIAPIDTLLALHIVLSLTYFSTLCLRLSAMIRQTLVAPERVPVAPPFGLLPRYTILVALYREEDMAEQLVASLKRLDWPASLLDIKFVCEIDDRQTIEALKALEPGPQFEIVEVPAYGPRTKPKALTYALKGARGEFTAIYDAEDRPHPLQLREAYRRFRAAPSELACLQAPLIITNARESWLSALFSLEYAALFRGLLPMLGRMNMPLPLGGTSNHFRTSALIAAGGWDPYNVTEDADLGMRLYRLGFTADVMRHQTLEDAPLSIKVWTSQRSRWFKGWLQTWLVLMRDPARLIGEIGIKPFCVIQLLVGGMLLSSLLHPLILVFLGVGFSAMLRAPIDTLPLEVVGLFAIDFTNILGSYLIFLGLGIGSMTDHEKRLVGRRWVAVPLYWMMTSFAAWKALRELRTKPFHWSKTPHMPRRKES
ncbi:glycosyltransferase family 2 protein [Rhizobium sp. Leaf321]|jgi:cellulose synthase/poly-beta-1,6-N-acetylglucosamine synthase-like glycosyltransferase|uniref:glycosyltransferase family 2 protein n=1 Tax=Rhizobium sp. Leaf321 TaxID=1736335 RepID=UPI0009ECBE28|nr:glycosyltransferase family 2 protein [Rhizobium sp. Leaf321]